MVITAAHITWTLPEAESEKPRDADDLLVDMLIEAQSYRVLAQRAIQTLHEVQLDRDLLKAQRALDRRRVREKAAA